jgi:hypothetical protein
VNKGDSFVVVGEESWQRVTKQPDDEVGTGNLGKFLLGEFPSGESGPPGLGQAGEYIKSGHLALA